MLNQKQYEFVDNENGSVILISKKCTANNTITSHSKLIKNELAGLFRKYGYLTDKKDYEVKIKVTSGNIAWINLNCIENIK